MAIAGQRLLARSSSDPRYRLGLADVQPDFLGRAYEYLLRKFAEGSGQSAGEFFTPTEVGFLMAHIVRPKGRRNSPVTPSTKPMEQMLWDAACSIRGEKDAAKFKDYLLPLLFLKRLSDVFDDEIDRLGEGLYHLAQLGRVDVALAVPLGGEVDNIDDSRERRILPHDCAHGFSKVLADVLGAGAAALLVVRPAVLLASADHRPTGFMRQVKAQQLMVLFGDLQQPSESAAAGVTRSRARSATIMPAARRGC
jgi:hypothetical protein